MSVVVALCCAVVAYFWAVTHLPILFAMMVGFALICIGLCIEDAAVHISGRKYE